MLGGSKGRNSATGRGVAISTKLILARAEKSLEDVSVAISGMGNVGGNAARSGESNQCRECPSVEADALLEERGIVLVPDIFANSGGVIVSCFEWVQNIWILTWNSD